MATTTGGYTLAIVAAASATLLLVAYRDYRAYVALGPHGLPDTSWGWYKQLKLSRLARKDTTVPAPYDIEAEKDTYGPHAATSFLADGLQPRRGSRPTIPGFVAPQRQISAVASVEMKVQMHKFLSALVAANSSALQYELSVLEGPVPAVQLKSDIARPAFLKTTKGEMIHVHPPDGSTHLTLSPADSRSVIEQGWGQRHRLSGGFSAGGTHWCMLRATSASLRSGRASSGPRRGIAAPTFTSYDIRNGRLLPYAFMYILQCFIKSSPSSVSLTRQKRPLISERIAQELNPIA